MIEGNYTSGLRGWLGKAKAKAAWNLLQGSQSFADLPQMGVQGDRKLMLYDVVRKVLGKDTENYPQEIGDCVSFGAKNAVEYVQCTEILMGGEPEKFKAMFPPYLYGTGRVFVGGGQINGDGSLGSWMAEAIIKFGAIPTDADGCPKYSGSVARKWGNNPGPPSQFVTLGKQHPVKKAAQITSWDALVTAICNGYPCTVASNQGFEMEARSDGFHAASGSWAHQMCIIGVDDTYTTPYAIVLNNWGDVHGRLEAFDGSGELPVGVLRVKKKVIQNMIDAGETFAYSNFDGFEEQPVAKELFKLI